MSEDGSVAPFQPARPEDHPDLLLYDYSKYLLTLALLVLGGVLSLTQGAGGTRIDKKLVIVVVLFLAVSGMSSLSCANEIVRVRTGKKKRTKWPEVYNQAAMGLLGGGVGAFLFVWAGALN